MVFIQRYGMLRPSISAIISQRVKRVQAYPNKQLCKIAIITKQ